MVDKGGLEMTAPAPARPDLSVLDRDITEALNALRFARALSARSPNARTAQSEEAAEWRLNAFLERRYIFQQA
jgi:hypothetical protein